MGGGELGRWAGEKKSKGKVGVRGWPVITGIFARKSPREMASSQGC